MMKKLVPFKKDINFDTNVALINSISLEHEVTKQGDHLSYHLILILIKNMI